MKLTKALKKLPEDLRIEISENEMRKDFTESEKARIQDLIREHLVRGSENGEKHTHGANEAIGEILGESHENVRRRDKVFEKAGPGLKKDLDAGKKSLGAAYREVSEKKAKPARIPDGKFAHIVEDPAWGWDAGALAKLAGLKMREVAADNSMLYMWAPAGRLIGGVMLVSDYLEIVGAGRHPTGTQTVQSDALAVMRCHGYAPKKITPFATGGVVKYLVIGTRGKIPHLEFAENPVTSQDDGAGWKIIEECVKNAGIGDSTRHKLVMDGVRDGWTGRTEELR